MLTLPGILESWYEVEGLISKIRMFSAGQIEFEVEFEVLEEEEEEEEVVKPL